MRGELVFWNDAGLEHSRAKDGSTTKSGWKICLAEAGIVNVSENLTACVSLLETCANVQAPPERRFVLTIVQIHVKRPNLIPVDIFWESIAWGIGIFGEWDG